MAIQNDEAAQGELQNAERAAAVEAERQALAYLKFTVGRRADQILRDLEAFTNELADAIEAASVADAGVYNNFVTDLKLNPGIRNREQRFQYEIS